MGASRTEVPLMGTLRTAEIAARRGVGPRAIVRAVSRGGGPRPDGEWPPPPGAPWEWSTDRPDVIAWLASPEELASMARRAISRHGSQSAAVRASGVDVATWRRVLRAEGWPHWKTALAVTRAAVPTGGRP